MSTFRLAGFTSTVHTLTVEPAGVFRDGEKWRFDLWCGSRLIFGEREFETPKGWSEDKIAAHALFWATFSPEEYDSDQDAPTREQRAWLDSYADYLSLALLASDGREVEDLSAHRVRD